MKIPGDEWDAVVVGAGVAGGCISALLADRGWRVLLLEKSTWPRDTVCGGCLSAAAVASLQQIGMGDAIGKAIETRSVVWESGGKTFEHAIPKGASVLRNHLDAAIVGTAVSRGVRFLPGCAASLLPLSAEDSHRTLQLKSDHRTSLVRAGIVVACDGINGTLLKDEPWARWSIARGARMGVAATYQCQSPQILPGRIHMCVGRDGYAGLVRIDEKTEHLAAALDPAACQAAGGPLNLIGEILRSNGRQIPANLSTARLYGTGRLTRHRKCIGGNRVLTLGDACGYVEPVTGEGMAWAAGGALELNRLLRQSANGWSEKLPRQWARLHQRTIGRQQRACRMMTTALHHSVLVDAGIFVGNAMPAFAEWIARSVCQPPEKEFVNDSIGHFPREPHPPRIATGDPGNRYGEPAGCRTGAVP